MERLVAGQGITKEDLVLLGQLPDSTHHRGQFYSQLRSGLLSMKSDPLVTFLIKQQQASLEQLFERAETENSAEVCWSIWWHQQRMLYLGFLLIAEYYKHK